MSRRFWRAAEVELLCSMYPECHTADVAAWLGRSVKSTYEAAKTNAVRKSDEYLASDAACRIHRGKQDARMIAHRFQKGQAAWNKDRKGVNGFSATRFKPGQMPQTWCPVGSVRIERDGPKVKVSDTRNKSRDWRYLHHLVWERAHGPIKPGQIIAFKPGMRTNDPAQITEDKLECVDRAELARRNHPRVRDPELGRLIQLKGAIARQVNRIIREART